MSEDLQQDTATTETQAEVPAAPQLQLSDILQTAQIIQLASSRGAFKPDEFTAIGGVYERVVAFLVANGAVKLADQDQEQAPAEQTTTADETASN
jgi:hypothetical protein